MTSSKDDSRRWSVFEIIDRIMAEAGRTKKLFMFMIITVMILPSGVLLIMGVFLPLLAGGADSGMGETQMEKILTAIKNKDLTPEEYEMVERLIFTPEPSAINIIASGGSIIFLLYLVWIIIGIRQWIVLSRWDKRYKEFKKSREQADKMFKDDET